MNHEPSSSEDTNLSKPEKETATQFFAVVGRDQWGDYGDVLVHGLTGTLPERDGNLQIERTGPFVPPITVPFSNELIVRDSIRQRFEELRLPGIGFRPVIKARIVASDWHLWDRTADYPAEPPIDENENGGEPEDYVLLYPHSEPISDQIGELWQVTLPKLGEFEVYDERPPFGHYLCLYLDSWKGQPLFLAKKRGSRANYRIIATRPVRDWLEARSDGWLVFPVVQTR